MSRSPRGDVARSPQGDRPHRQSTWPRTQRHEASAACTTHHRPVPGPSPRPRSPRDELSGAAAERPATPYRWGLRCRSPGMTGYGRHTAAPEASRRRARQTMSQSRRGRARRSRRSGRSNASCTGGMRRCDQHWPAAVGCARRQTRRFHQSSGHRPRPARRRGAHWRLSAGLILRC